MSVGERGEHIAVPPDRKAAALAVLDRHPCVVPSSVRYTGTHLLFAVDLGALPPGDGPAVCEVIRRDIERAARRP